MLDKFWESIGSDLADRWLEYIFGPAFLFWAGGLGLYVWKTGPETVLKKIQALTAFQQGGLIVLALLVLVFSSLLMQALRFPVLRLLEGYWPWPFNYLALAIAGLRKSSFANNYGELRRLKDMESQGTMDAKQRDRLDQLELWAHWLPARANDLMATGLGNALRARELSPKRKYGLDAVVCWPRLWSLLPENVRGDLDSARGSLDRLVELWFWGALFLLWAWWTPWAAVIIAVVWLIVTYSMALQSAMAYGDLLESAFDLYRLSLYDALKWPAPINSKQEKEQGARLTEFLWRGTLPQPLIYEDKGE